MEVKLEQQRVEMQAQLDQARAKIQELTLTTPQEAITTKQVSELTARIGRLHSTHALKEDELFAVEDCIADFLEVKSGADVVTIELVNAHHAIGKVHKLILLSEGLVDDAMFARQVRRKFC